MSMVSVDINQLNRAIIKVGSRASLASRLGKGASYISYVIESGEMEEELAEKIAVDYNIDVILGDTRILGTSTISKPQEKPVKYTKITAHVTVLKDFIGKFCKIRKDAECLFSDLFNTYLIYIHSLNDVGMAKQDFINQIVDEYGVNTKKAVVTSPFNYIPSCMNKPYQFVPQRRLVVEGMTLNTDALDALIREECLAWIEQDCKFSDEKFDISKLHESFNNFHSDKIKFSYTYFKSMLTFLGFQLACEAGSNVSTYCRGLVMKDDYKKKAIINDLYGIKQADLTLKEINPLPQEQSIMEQLLAEQRRTNDLLEDLISIWK